MDVDFLPLRSPASRPAVPPPEHHHHQSTQYLIIWQYVCFLFPIYFLPHGLSAQPRELRCRLWTGEVKAPVSSWQQSPCSGCTISQHRTRALNKLVIISSTAAAAVIVKMEFQPTWLSWGGETGRQQGYETQRRLAAGHLWGEYFRKWPFKLQVS